MKAEHLQRCQVATPPDVASLLWRLALKARDDKPFESVLDLGAGDARFARSPAAKFERYLGIEWDSHKIMRDGLPPGAHVLRGDAMAWDGPKSCIAIGNPPFIKSARLDPAWRSKVLDQLEAESGARLKHTANLYILFLLQALLRTSDDGLVVQLVPYEWVTRPSALELREYINQAGWDVKVYRFDTDIFPRVLTTASIVMIDKRVKSGAWEFGEMGREGIISLFRGPTGSSKTVLPYSKQDGSARAIRGLSPGGQEIFVLTEQERLHFSLRKRRDVVPCVTSLRRLTPETTTLDASTFDHLYVKAGARCWLIRSDRKERSKELSHYLESVGTRWKRFSTCTSRQDWAQYAPHPAPALLVSSGFVGKAPKIVMNAIGAIAVGSVYGVLTGQSSRKVRSLASRLRSYDFRSRVVHHSNNLKKLEVRQLNAVLSRLTE